MPDLPIPSPNGSGLILLEHGKAYAGTVRPRSGQSVLAVGDESKPPPLVRSTGFGVDVDGHDDLIVGGIVFESAKPTKDVSGIKLYHASNVAVRGCTFRGFGHMGAQSQTYKSGRRNKNVLFEDCVFERNHPAGSSHVSGLYASHTDGLVLRGCVFDTNGWLPGKRAATVFNHGAYLQSNNGPALIERCIFRNNSATGLQARSGGDIRDCVFIDNPVGMTYGYVNGAACFTGGVSGTVERLVFIGGRTVAGKPHGWCMDLGNVRDATVQKIILAHYHGTEGSHNAVNVIKCEKVEGGPSVGVLSLTLEDIYGHDRDRPFPLVKDGKPRMSNVGNPPPTEADLREAIKGLDSAKAIVERCFQLLGLAPQPQPEPAPAPALTLESAIRDPGLQLVFIIEGGQAKIKLIASGPDPRWIVTGDTITRE